MKLPKENIVIFLALTFIFPYGVYLLWRRGKFKRVEKVYLTILFALLAVVSLGIFACFAPAPAPERTTLVADMETTLEKATSETSIPETTVAVTTVVETTVVETTAPDDKTTSAQSALLETTRLSASEKVTQAPVTTPSTATPTVAPLKIIDFNSTVRRNEEVTLKIQGKPSTTYNISVYYSSGASKADGLESKTSDSSGSVSWSWKVGGKTNPGTYNIVVTGGGQNFETKFTVIA